MNATKIREKERWTLHRTWDSHQSDIDNTRLELKSRECYYDDDYDDDDYWLKIWYSVLSDYLNYMSYINFRIQRTLMLENTLRTIC